MRETPSPDGGFVVDWQLTDDPPVVIDLSTAESEVVLSALTARVESTGR